MVEGPKVAIDVIAPLGMDRLDIAQCVVGSDWLLKAERHTTKVWERYRPMREAHVLEIEAYRAVLRRMLHAIVEFIEADIVGGKLEKSAAEPLEKGIKHFVLLSPKQLRIIRKLIGSYHEALVAGAINPDLLEPDELERLIRVGVVPKNFGYVYRPRDGEPLPPKTKRNIAEAYHYGKELGELPPAARRPLKETSYARWNAKERKALVPTEQQAVRWAEERAATYVRGLGRKFADDFTTTVIDKELELRHKQAINTAVASNIERRESWREIVADVRDQTEDYARDYGRIAATEKARALQEGTTRQLMEDHGDPDEVMVAKLPTPSACRYCVSLHLTAGKGSPPRVFKLSELIKNGSNVGRKAADWLATVGPAHPWCMCELVHIPKGWTFDEAGTLVPAMLTRAMVFEGNLRKAEEHLSYGAAAVPDTGVSVRVGDPYLREEVEKVVAATPPEVFSRGAGVTLITTDSERPGVPLAPGDFAYWTGNEIRLMQTLDPKRVARVLRHEIGHSLNVWALGKLGTVEKLRAWHDKLWAIAQEEGFVSVYAKLEPIENHGEATSWYLYRRAELRMWRPRTFAALHRMYRDLIRPAKG